MAKIDFSLLARTINMAFNGIWEFKEANNSKSIVTFAHLFDIRPPYSRRRMHLLKFPIRLSLIRKMSRVVRST